MGVPLPARRTALLAAAFVGAAILSAAGPGGAVEGIAIVDYQMIFDRFEATADAQRTLDRELKEWEQLGKDMRAEIDSLNTELESQKLMLSEDRLREKEDDLRRKRDDYEGFMQETFGVNGKAAKRNAELTQPIAEKILDVIAKVGKESNLKIIFDAGSGGVVWAEDDVNITQVVLDDLSLAVTESESSPDVEVPEDAGGDQ